MANSILMPPILEFNYPSFDMEENIATFIGKLSINNTLKQVDHIQVKLLQQDDGKNGLNTELFPHNIYFIKNESEDIFSIRLKLFINGVTIFNNSKQNLIPTFYKMQVRLGYKDETQLDKMYKEEWGQSPSTEWLDNNANLFSEWSNTAIIKTTFAPKVQILNLKLAQVNNLDNPYQLFNAAYETNDTTENIQAYRFELLDAQGFTIEKQELNYVKDYITPSITYQIKTYIKTQTTYVLKLTTQSTQGFVKSVSYEIYFTDVQKDFPLKINTIIDNVNAVNKIKISYDNSFKQIDKILIKRLSLSNQYNSYDDIYEIIDVKNKVGDIYFVDYLINSDELYIYYLQLIYMDKTYSSLSQPITAINSYDYTYILGENHEQFIIYSPQISALTLTKHDTFTETLGERYPYFQKIGTANYKTFGLTGNITYLAAEEEKNSIKEDTVKNIYGINAPQEIQQLIQQSYGTDVGNNYINTIDYFMEKEYRDKIIDFLNNGEIKVIKSPTERLLFTRFTNVNVTPKTELSRAIYDFSINATEISNESTIDYKKYNFGEVYEL